MLACQSDVSTNPDSFITDGTDKIMIDFSSLNAAELSACDLETVQKSLQESNFKNIHPDQVTDCYTIEDMTFAFVSQPNTWTALIDVREWEKEGNQAWSGLVFQRAQEPMRIFFQIPENDYNPVGLYLQSEALILDVADDSGAGSGEGNLLRFVYPFAGVSADLLYKWSAEKCTGYYNPDTYSKTYKDCNENSSNDFLTYSNDDYGIEFNYPSNWELYDMDSEGVLDMRVFNQPAPDGFGCSEPYVGFYIVSTLRDTEAGDFDAWMKANFNKQDSLGSFGGYMTPATIETYPAYKVGGFGWESYCPQTGYVVDYGDDRIVEIIFEGKEDSPDYQKLAPILDSLQLTGY